MSLSQPAERRVVITGVGFVTPLGSTKETLAAALSEGRSGVSRRPSEGDEAYLPIGAFADQFTGGIGDFGELDAPRKKAVRKGLKLMCRETQMAVAAAQHALADAGDADAFDPERVGVVLGSDYMLTLPVDYAPAIQKCVADGSFDFDRWGGDGLGEMPPLWMLKYLPNMPASHIAIYNDLRGPNNSLTLREASGLAAIGEATRILAGGRADRMIAGATGTRVLPMQAIHALQSKTAVPGGPPVLSDAPGGADPATLSRPFDRDRVGAVCGEGAGMVVLETLDAANARGATIYGELSGFASAVVAQPTPRGLVGNNQQAIASAIRAALADANTQPSDLGHVNADGLGTPDADRDESAALHASLGEAGGTTPVFAPKSYFGNLGAGGGVAELIASLLSLAGVGPLAGALPRTLNHDHPDPDCGLAVSDGSTVPGDSFVAVNATPQGQSAAVCVRRVA